ncbi:hypothetical protein BKI52_16235 [marine bacterium AO1-C]|nr:hypothetical protein BKI52_16235 [marine bacterium AO1-C]
MKKMCFFTKKLRVYSEGINHRNFPTLFRVVKSMKKIIKWGFFSFLAIIISNSLQAHQSKNVSNYNTYFKNTLTSFNNAETIFVHRGDQVKVKFDEAQAVYQIRIHNPVGRVIGRFKTASNEFVVETKSWRTGIYYIVISKNGKYKERKKVVVSS